MIRRFAGIHDPRTGKLALAREASTPPQPTVDATTCLLDGEIYNLADLARAAGIDRLDTAEPTLALLYERRGAGLIEHLRGDFALALWRADRGEGVIARDHMGGRSLYWARAGRELLFASDLTMLLELLPARPGPDEIAIAHWLGISGMPADRTLYAGIHRLEAGHLLGLSEDSTPRRYWEPVYRSPLRGPRAELADGLRARLAQAVERRAAGESAAVLLSGGLDSSAVAALASTALDSARRPTCAYSAVFPRHPSIDESALIDRLCQDLGLESIRAVVRRGSVLGGALPYLERTGLPPVSPNLFFWLPLLARASEHGTKVMLDGEGGDELFGLSPTLVADRLLRGRMLSVASLMRSLPGLSGKLPRRAALRRFLTEYGLKAATPLVVHRAVARRRGDDVRAPAWLLPAVRRSYAETLDYGGWKRLSGPRWWAYLVDVTTRGMGPALVYEHSLLRARMAGIEPRHPLVDVDVIEYVLHMPPEVAYHPDHTRPLLREALAGVLPDAVRLRPAKSTFDALFHESLAGQDLPALRSLLEAPDAELRAYVDHDRLRRELLDPEPPSAPGERQTWALRVWRLATAELWLRFQHDRALPRRLLERAGVGESDVELVERTSAVRRSATAPPGRVRGAGS